MTKPKAEAAAKKSAAETNLDELRQARDALADAIEALKTTMRGSHPNVRAKFVVKLGFAYGRLRQVIARAQGDGP